MPFAKKSVADKMIRTERLAALKEITLFWDSISMLDEQEIINLALTITRAMNRDYSKPLGLFMVEAK